MKKKSLKFNEKPISLAPVRFEDAIAAALETPPERKPKRKRSKLGPYKRRT